MAFKKIYKWFKFIAKKSYSDKIVSNISIFRIIKGNFA